MNPTLCLVLSAGWAALADVVAQPPAPPPAAAATARVGGPWSEGRGRAASYRAALTLALEDAVTRARGVGVARGPQVQSRLAVVAQWGDELPDGWFDGTSDAEHAWVQSQVRDFLGRYAIQSRQQREDGSWELVVRAQVVDPQEPPPPFVLQVVGNELAHWQLERFEAGAQGAAFASDRGEYRGPSFIENLRRSGEVRIQAVPRGDAAAAAPGPLQASPGPLQASPGPLQASPGPLQASHRVTVEWQPMALQSQVERPNKARPTVGPRPESLVAAGVAVRLRVEDLVAGTELFDRPLTIALEVPPGTGLERRDAYVVQLADRAAAIVAEHVFFALRPPVVLRKWVGDGGEWFVEVRLARRLAAGYDEFVIGSPGTLARPDWQPLGGAVLVGGTETSCTFALRGVEDPGRIEPAVSEVRPLRQ